MKGHEIPLSALPAGSTESEWTTTLEEIKDFERNFGVYKHRVMACVLPKEVKELQGLEQRIG